jgi:CDP-glucose 4,6-dehydratase
MALPPNTNPSLFELLSPWKKLNHTIVDVRDQDRTIAAISRSDAEVLLHLAAQPIVSKAQADAPSTFATNVMGTVHVLEGALRSKSISSVLIITTDKIYANVGKGLAFREEDPLSGDDPYSASKAAAELAVSAYRLAFEAGAKKVATARAGNVIGGGDWALDRIVPDLVRSLTSGMPTVIRNLTGVRPWQHVLEPLSGYIAFAEQLATRKSAPPAALNLGPAPESSRTVSELISRFLSHFPQHPGVRESPAQTFHEAPMLRLDSAKAAANLNWHPRLSFEKAVDWTAEWYSAHHMGANMRAQSLQQIARYEAYL